MQVNNNFFVQYDENWLFHNFVIKFYTICFSYFLLRSASMSYFFRINPKCILLFMMYEMSLGCVILLYYINFFVKKWHLVLYNLLYCGAHRLYSFCSMKKVNLYHLQCVVEVDFLSVEESLLWFVDVGGFPVDLTGGSEEAWWYLVVFQEHLSWEWEDSHHVSQHSNIIGSTSSRLPIEDFVNFKSLISFCLDLESPVTVLRMYPMYLNNYLKFLFFYSIV